MKCPVFEATRNKMEKVSGAAESKVFHHTASPMKVPSPISPQNPSTGGSTVLLSDKDSTSVGHDKENSTSSVSDRTLDECFEDSGYLSLNSSQIHVEGDPKPTFSPCAVTRKETFLSNKSPSKCQERTKVSHPVCLAISTPLACFKTKTATLSSTPSKQHDDPNLPILKFQQAVCEKLAQSYKKNKKYDWSIISETAKEHLLDRVIGRQMGLEHVDIFTSLLSRNMKSILTNILSLLGDLDLISCKKVSKTWRRIICDDKAALMRCQRAEQISRESRTSCGLTRDVGVSRVVLSCIQTLASSCTPSTSSSSKQSHKANKVISSSQKTPTSQCTRFNEYVQAAGGLKQHESLRSCRRCGSPATHSAEVQRATCTRSSCLYDFCTLCQESFHGSSPCRMVQSRTHFPTDMNIPGRTRCKRNLKRL